MSAATTDGGSPLAVPTALASVLPRRARQALIAASAAQAAWQLARSAHRALRARTEYRVAVLDSDDLYWPLLVFVAEQMPAQSRRALMARTKRAGQSLSSQDSDLVSPDVPGARPARVVTLTHDAHTRAAAFTLDGHRVRVSAERAERNTNSREWYRDTLVLTVAGADGLAAVERLLDSLAGRLDEKGDPDVFVTNPWGNWSKHQGARGRPLSSVMLPDDTLVDDLAEFLSAEHAYVRLGLPWHRGYFLHGPPGTGKSSTAMALASHFGLPMFVAKLSAIESDAALARMLADMPSRAMLLIEDIDLTRAGSTIRALTERREASEAAEEPDGVSLEGVLNALDGVETPHGMVTVMTSNRPPEDFDAALMRGGRADVHYQLGPLTRDGLDRLVSIVVPDADAGAWAKLRPGRIRPDLTASDVVGAVRPLLSAPAGARLGAIAGEAALPSLEGARGR